MKRLLFLLVLVCLLISAKSFPSDIPFTPLEKTVYRIGYCESRNNHNVRPGDNGLAVGKYQFHKRTFSSFAREAGRPELKRESLPDQEWLVRWAVQRGYGSSWTCYPHKKTHQVVKINYHGVFSKHKTKVDYAQNLMPVKADLLTIRI